MLNEVVLIGRLGKDAEIRVTPGGMKVATISLPLYHSYSPEGKKTEWVQCEAYGKYANVVEQAKKGVLVSVIGELSIPSWEDEGNYRNRTFIKIDSFRFLEKKKTSDNEIIQRVIEDEKIDESIEVVDVQKDDKLDDIDAFLKSFKKKESTDF